MVTQEKPKPDAISSDDAEKTPPAGPHAKPSLTDNEKTPGAGTLPDSDPDSVDAGTG